MVLPDMEHQQNKRKKEKAFPCNKYFMGAFEYHGENQENEMLMCWQPFHSSNCPTLGKGEVLLHKGLLRDIKNVIGKCFMSMKDLTPSS
jgi:hypothetical protein